MTTDWIQQARTKSQKMRAPGTANTAVIGVSSVSAVPHPPISSEQTTEVIYARMVGLWTRTYPEGASHPEFPEALRIALADPDAALDSLRADREPARMGWGIEP